MCSAEPLTCLLLITGAAAAGGTVGVAGLSSGNTGSQRSGFGSNTGTGSNTGYGSNTGSGSNTGYGSNTGSGTTGYGSGNTGNTESSTAAKAKSYIPGTAENKASHGNGGNTGYGSGYSSTGTASGSGFGSGNAGSNIVGGLTGQPGQSRGGITTGQTTAFGHEQAPQSGAAVYNADGVSVSSLAGGTTGAQHAIGSGSGSNTGSGLKSHIPGTQEHRETQGTGSGTGYGSSNAGSGTGFGSSNTSASNIGRDAGYTPTSGNTGTNTGFSGGTGNTGSNTGYGSGTGNTGSNTGYGSSTGNTDRDGKPSAGEKLKKLIPGTPEYKAAHGNNSEGYNTGRDTTTGQHYGVAFTLQSALLFYSACGSSLQQLDCHSWSAVLCMLCVHIAG